MTAEEVDSVVRMYEDDIGPLRGAQVVARAWRDDAFRARLLESAGAAVEEMAFPGIQPGFLVAVENGPKVHNLVVCTLCSCYPWAVLGLPPEWYKSPAYRSRAVREPRKVLAEFGLELDSDVEIRVWDSSAEIRYFVLPERPAGGEGLSEEELAAVVTRDVMIGVAKPSEP